MNTQENMSCCRLMVFVTFLTHILSSYGQVTPITVVLDIKDNKYIIKDTKTKQYFAESKIDCALHCLDTPDCCRSSFSKENRECIVDKNNGCLAPIGTNADSLLMEKKLECGPGWEEYNGRCILYTQTKMNWDDSVTFCNSNGGRLFVIESVEENIWLKDAVQVVVNGPLIGAHKNGSGSLVWYDGRGHQLPVDQTFWQSGEPNGGNIDSCVMIRKDTGGWNDIPCDNPTQAVICEKMLP